MEERCKQDKKEGSAGEKNTEEVSAGGEESDSSKEKKLQDEDILSHGKNKHGNCSAQP
jgi:hypothetical protein